MVDGPVRSRIGSRKILVMQMIDAVPPQCVERIVEFQRHCRA
jgi:hypothetical protein